MRPCEDFTDLISASLDGVLTAQEQSELDAHLAACPVCSALYAQLSDLHQACADLDELPAPAGFTERVMDCIRADAGQQQTDNVIPFPAKKANRSPWKRWGTTAAAVVLVVGAVSLAGQFGGIFSHKAYDNMAVEMAPGSGGSSSMAQNTEKAMMDSATGGMGAGVQNSTASDDAMYDTEVDSMMTADSSLPENAPAAPQDSTAEKSDSAGGPTLPGAMEIYPTVMVEGNLYQWRSGAAILSEGLPEGCVRSGEVIHVEGDTPAENGQFVSVFDVTGQIYTHPEEPGVAYLCLTTDWMTDTVVIFDRVT